MIYNITLVNITIQPYFVLSYKHLAMHLWYSAPFKTIIFHWLKRYNKLGVFFFYMKTTKFSLFEQDRTIVVLRRNEKCLKKNMPRGEKVTRVAHLQWIIHSLRQPLHQQRYLSSNWFIEYWATMLIWRPVVWSLPCDPKSGGDNLNYNVNQCS